MPGLSLPALFSLRWMLDLIVGMATIEFPLTNFSRSAFSVLSRYSSFSLSLSSMISLIVSLNDVK